MHTKPAPNLASDPVGGLLVRLAVPTIVAQLVNMLYNMVDRVYIGHIPETGDLALTGLGLCFPIIMVITAFSNLFGTGGAPRVAMCMGQGDTRQAERILGSCTAALIAMAAVLTISLEAFAEPLLRMFGASDNTLPYALSYLRVYIGGTIFVMLTLGLNSFINTQGFSNIGMKTVIIGAVCNIILDPVFIFLLDMGVTGAAWATVISQGISAVWVLRFLTGEKTLIRLQARHCRLRKSILLPVMALGISPFVMNATESAINICFNASLQRYGGDLAVGALTILHSIMMLMNQPAIGLGQGGQPIVSYNYGAGNGDRVMQTIKLLTVIGVGYTMSFWALIELFPTFFIRLFNDSPELLELSTWALRVYMGATGVFGFQHVIQQVFTALGQAKISLFIACLRKLILLIPLIYILPHFLADQVFAVFLAEPIADFLSVSTALTLFLLNIKRILNTVPDLRIKE